jgi:hypothetical protein
MRSLFKEALFQYSTWQKDQLLVVKYILDQGL